MKHLKRQHKFTFLGLKNQKREFGTSKDVENLMGNLEKDRGYPESVYNGPCLLLTTVLFLHMVGNQFSRECPQLVSEQNNCLSRQKLSTDLRNA